MSNKFRPEFRLEFTQENGVVAVNKSWLERKNKKPYDRFGLFGDGHKLSEELKEDKNVNAFNDATNSPEQDKTLKNS